MEGRIVLERRWCVRKSFIMAVTLHHEGRQLGNCKTRDISPEGLFVETDTTEVDLHAVLDVSLPTSVIGAGHSRRIPVAVVHKRANGLGLMFCSFDQRLHNRLNALLESLPSTHAA